MDLNKLRTSIKSNKRRLMEQEGYYNEGMQLLKKEIEAKIEAFKEAVNGNIETLNTQIENKIIESVNFTTMVPTSTSVSVGITTSTENNKQFTAPFNGYFYILLNGASSESVYCILNRTCGDLRMSTTAGPWDSVGLFLPCRKGDTIEYRRDLAPANLWQAKFIKAGEV